eukprot:CAMPEP_0184189444 /NCGR_PEP_ID=MMETSP0976-20121227/1961_1 /TAXON_ID=483370 /ORGANISM="non described non described, Strain CCMP2097" /LENGTH=59 /DNA_ID=CAMNT_0026493805 /DNA_START=323 /DNA_END=502 /DNA_ORIENTATION=+
MKDTWGPAASKSKRLENNDDSPNASGVERDVTQTYRYTAKRRIDVDNLNRELSEGVPGA